MTEVTCLLADNGDLSFSETRVLYFFLLQRFNVFLLLKENPGDALETENEVLRSEMMERDTLTSYSFT